MTILNTWLFGTKTPRRKAALLGSAAMVACLPLWSGEAIAQAVPNTVTVGGVDMTGTYVDPTSGRVSVTNDSAGIGITVGSPIGNASTPYEGDAVFAWTTEEITIDATADLYATGQGIWADSTASSTDPSDVAITSTGRIVSRDLNGIGVIDVHGNLSIDGAGTGSVDGDDTGIYIAGGSPRVHIRDFSSVVGNGRSIYIDSNDGDVSIQGIGQIGDAESADDGIYADATSGGNIDIGDIDTVTGGDDGIETYTSGTGTTTIAVGDVTAVDMGIYSRAEAGGIDISATGTIEATATSAIDALATTGSIAIDGNGTATATGIARGIRTETEGGNIDISGFGTVTASDIAVEALSAGGDITISGMGITGGITSADEDGIHANGETTGGNVTISNIGPITAGDDGIEAYSHGAGNMTIGVTEDITGGEFGVYSRSVDGDMDIDITGATVVGTNATGIDALATGNGITTIDIANDAIVEGAGWGVVTGNTATVTNSGTVRTTGDTGAADNAGLGDAVWSWTGATTFENDGNLLGQVHSDGDGLTLSNNAAGSWYAGTGDSVFDGAADTVRNAGTIYMRDGTTSFVGLETFSNLSGGHVDLTYGAGANESLELVNLESAAGSRYSFNFDSTLPNNSGTGFDDTEDGLGTADTIVVSGTATAQSGTLVNVAATGGDPKGLTGSVALIYTGTDLTAPAPGASIADSEFYSFGETNLEDAATAFHLVDDGAGGVYLQWGPNITSTTMGAYMGGSLSGSGSSAASIASSSGVFAGIGGLGLPETGASGKIAGMAVAGVLNPQADCSAGRTRNTWAQIDGGSISGTGVGGTMTALTMGIEQDLSDLFDQNCGRIAGGAVLGFGRASSQWQTGQSDTDNRYVGGYLRFSSDSGFYATVLGVYNESDTDMQNAIFGSVASQSADGYSATLTAGYLVPQGEKGHLDFRGFVGHAVSDGDSFVDSAGIQVDSSKSRLTSVGLSVGYLHEFSETQHGFLRAGVKHVEVARDITAFGVTTSGRADATFFSVSGGVTAQLDKNISIDAGLSADFADGIHSVTGSLRLSVKF